MQTKRKSNSIITHEVLESGALRFNVVGAGSFTFDPAKASEANRAFAGLHGWIQRISDGGAISRDEETGLPATPADKLERMVALRDHYETGSAEWRLTGTGTGPQRSITVLAIARVNGLTFDDAAAHVQRYADAHYDGDGKKTLAFFRTSGKVQEAIAALRAEALGKPSLDADEALNEIT